MQKFVYTDQFDKVFSTFDLNERIASLKDSSKFNEKSILYIVDASYGTYIYAQGHLFGVDFDIKKLSEFISEQHEQISKHDDEIRELNEVINSKVDTSTLIEDELVIAGHVASLQDDVSVLKETINSKVDTSTLIEDELVIAGHVASLQDDVSVLKETINSKVDVSALIEDELVIAGHVASLHEDVSVCLNNISTGLNDISTKLNDTSIVINQHIDSSFIQLNSSINTLNTKCDDTQTIVQSAVTQLLDTGVVTLNQPVIDLTNTGLVYDTSIEPNKMYMFGEKTELTINHLIEGLSGIVNEYMFQFTSSSTGDCSLNVPNTVKWMITPNIQNSKFYMVSIENNLGLIGEWNNE